MNDKTMPWWVMPSLAALALLIFAGALGASCFIADTTLRTTMFTGAYGIAATAAGYYFGSSASSQKKDQVIAAVARPDDPARPAAPQP